MSNHRSVAIFHTHTLSFADVAGLAATTLGANPLLTPSGVQEKMEDDSKSLSEYKSHARKLITTVGGCEAPTPTPTPCPAGEKHLKVTIHTDTYPGETTWTVTNTCTSDTTVMSGGPYSTASHVHIAQQCVQDGKFDFTIQV